MATKTIGTLATGTLTGVQFSHDPNGLSNADLAAIANSIFKDGSPNGGNVPGVIMPGAFTRAGLLFLPEGEIAPIKVREGDWVATDLAGNAFYIPKRALPTTLTLTATTTNGSPAMTATTSLRTAGWVNGTPVTGTGIPAASVVGDIAANGLSFNLYKNGVKVNATAGNVGITITGGSFTHS